ncbi:peritrophin-44-like [Lucilia sericata]|uniref:peritrophin-44-like n=1 Tax=Lucilia sericata TaxID=13632 RepID=UPI0018A8066A|nr:peritrophin-44-like [Lucilia sericata]
MIAKFVFILTISLFGFISGQQHINVDELCSLAPNALILQPNSCSDWLRCPSSPGASDMEDGSCVFGLYFNKNTGKCEYKDKVVCPFESRSKNVCAGEADGSFVAVKDECNAYIYCSEGEENKSYCPSNLVFNPITKSCVYQNQYKCPVSKPPVEGDALCKSLPDGLFFADKQDCTKYSLCKNGELQTYSCNSSHAWDYIQGACVSIDNVVCLPSAKKPEPELKVCVNTVGPISDGISCSGYYFCKKMSNDTHDRKPEHFNCPAGTFFDQQTNSCRDRLNVKCTLNRCEGMGNKYVNMAGDCRKYILCQNGEPFTNGTCPNSYYFDERTQGCTPQVVNYAACMA